MISQDEAECLAELASVVHEFTDEMEAVDLRGDTVELSRPPFAPPSGVIFHNGRLRVATTGTEVTLGPLE